MLKLAVYQAGQEMVFVNHEAVAGSLYFLLNACVNYCASKYWCKNVLTTSVKCLLHILNYI